MSARGVDAPTVADAAERERAVDIARSFIVQAPAGSGKTELLIRRLLALLAVVERPESIVAITFTRKAAAEMRERVVSALADAESGTEPDTDYERERYRLAVAALERSRSQGWELLDNPGRLEISTIDSLAAKLAASMPLLSRFGRVPAVAEDATPLYRIAARRTLEDADRDEGLGRAVRTLLDRREMRIEQLEEQIVGMLALRDQWTGEAVSVREDQGASRLVERAEAAFAEAMTEELERLVELLGADEIDAVHVLARQTRTTLEGAGKACEWPTLGGEDGLLGTDLDCVPAWSELRSFVLTKAGGLRKNAVDGAKKGDPAHASYKDLLERLSANERLTELERVLARMDAFPRSPRFSREGREGLLALFRVLLHAHAALWSIFRETASADFIEVAGRAVAALGDADQPSELLERLDRRIEHLLIDEFQDTSLVQSALVERLTSGWTEGDGRTLFLVGDPMQSIYRFRKAEVGLFLDARAGRGPLAHVSPTPLQLGVNFRSQPCVIEWVNTSFSELMGDRDDAGRSRVAYAPAAPRPGRDAAREVDLWFWNEPAAAPRAGDGEAAGLAALIRDELLPQALARGGTVAVLVRERRHASPLMKELRACGVGYRAEGMEFLADRSVIYDLASLTGFLLHRGDRLSALALLRSPMIGVSLADLARLVEPDVAAARDAERTWRDGARDGEPRPRPRSITSLLADEAAVARMSHDGRERARRCLRVLKGARARVGRSPLATVVQGAWLELGGPCCVDAAEALDAERYFDLVDELDRGAAIDTAELARRLTRLEANVDPDPAIAVDVMTMHKAKGLEFDTVVLPRLAKQSGRGTGPPLIFETDTHSGRMTMVALARARGRENDDDAKYALVLAREQERERSETLRLLYVAATRAKQRLVLSASAGLTKNGRPASGSLLATLWPALGFEGAPEAREPPAAAAGSAERGQTRIASGWSGPALPPRVRTRELRARRPSDVGGDEAAGVADSVAGGMDEALATAAPESWAVSPMRRNAGIAVHEWLERIAAEGVDVWSTERVEAERPRIRRRLSMLATPAGEIGPAESLVVEALLRTLGDERGRWILGHHDEDRSEWRLTRFAPAAAPDHEDLLVDYTNASLDRSFVEDGVRWIVDYKVVAPEEGAGSGAGEGTLDAFLAEKKTLYRPQLEDYARLAVELEPGRPVKLALYFPLIAATVVWDYARSEPV
jgi:ATP-dependent helicase/nuclease subunit A